ncbi:MULTISPECIES: phospholipase A [Psychrobacter]|uniref:phospholipase A n=1 Tax=Psychrobacter TaxID=497 RepID=UPI001CB6C31F|nr:MULTISPECIES: phospholipase A [Psychrobacter]
MFFPPDLGRSKRNLSALLSPSFSPSLLMLAMMSLAAVSAQADELPAAKVVNPSAQPLISSQSESRTIKQRLLDSNAPRDKNDLISDAYVSQKARLFVECTKVQTDAARLACFDKVAEDGVAPTFVSTNKRPLDVAKTLQSTISGKPQVVLAENITPIDADTVEDADVVLVTDEPIAPESLNTRGIDADEAQILEEVGVSKADIEKYTPLSLLYDLDKNSERGTWTARPHRPMYLLPVFLNLDPNRNPSSPTQALDRPYTSGEVRTPELKLQISLKTKVLEDLFDTEADLWFGYTQQSHWQVFNAENSRPFRATDYEPEVFLTQPVTANLPFNGRLRMLGAGAVHHSNGQDDPLSRSWNRAYVMAGAEWGKLTVIPRLWTRIKNEGGGDLDDNPDITDFMGYGDLTFLYDLADKTSLSGTLRYNPKTQHGAAQIDYIYPLTKNINGYIQFFQGYGESIIDYNHNNTAIGAGIMLSDWKGL